MADPTQWVVHAHQPIQELGERLWAVRSSLPGQVLGRSMVLAKLGSGDLVVYNPCALDEASMQEIDAWGPVRWIVTPGPMHRSDTPRFVARYPEAGVLCPSGAHKAVGKIAAIAGGCEDLPADDNVKLFELDGAGGREAVLQVRDRDGTSLALCDAIFNLPHQPGFGGLLAKWMGSSGGPRVTPLGRMFLGKNRPAFKAHLLRLANIPELRRVIVQHKEWIEEDPAAVLRDVEAAL